MATEGRLAPTRVLSPRWARAFALDTTLRRALAQPAADTSRAADAARRAHLTALLAEQAVALTILQTSIDSLKASLSEVPPALPVAAADSTVLPDAAPDAWRHLPPARSAWAVAALLETTPGWATAPVRAAGADAEQTQRSLTQSIQLQRQLTPRWLVRGGIGITQTQTQTSRTSERSGTTTVRDSVLTTTVSIRITTSTSQIVRVDPVLHVEPLVNLSGQIIGYDTTWRFTADTLLIPLINRDTLRQTRTVVTARTTQWREARQQLFRPTYRFWTLPVAVQFQALRTDRWTLGATVGGQLSVFRSGETPVRVADGYELRRVSARDSPYRPVSLSFSAGLEATYRLSPRLSALVAPTLRGWLVPPGRAGTRTQRLLPALQVGLTYGL